MEKRMDGEFIVAIWWLRDDFSKYGLQTGNREMEGIELWERVVFYLVFILEKGCSMVENMWEHRVDNLL